MATAPALVHSVPEGDVLEHELTDDCPCGPDLVDVGSYASAEPLRVIVQHHVLDPDRPRLLRHLVTPTT